MVEKLRFTEDITCDRCGKNIAELYIFGGPGDPLVGDFSGVRLVKTFRPMVEDKDIDPKRLADYRVIETFLHDENDYKAAEKKFSPEIIAEYERYDDLKGSTMASWECRECIVK